MNDELYCSKRFNKFIDGVHYISIDLVGRILTVDMLSQFTRYLFGDTVYFLAENVLPVVSELGQMFNMGIIDFLQMQKENK